MVYSGDVVRSDEEGYLYYVGRRDTLIKTMGFRVSPDEVASVLYASGAIVESIILSEPDEQRGERIVAYLVLKPEGTVDQIRAFCATELPRYMQPARYEVRDSLPRTSSGKFDPKSLKPSAEGSGEGLSNPGRHSAVGSVPQFTLDALNRGDVSHGMCCDSWHFPCTPRARMPGSGRRCAALPVGVPGHFARHRAPNINRSWPVVVPNCSPTPEDE